MTVWQYVAVESKSRTQRDGQLTASSSSEARTQLRRAGLQIVRLREVRAKSQRSSKYANSYVDELHKFIAQHHRRRRHQVRADFFDGLSTLLSSGVPLLQAIETLADANDHSARSYRRMLETLREELRGGQSLSESMARHDDWFEPTEVAMIAAGQQGGHLDRVLARLATQQARSSALYAKLIGTLMYPAVITVVAIGVMVFMSLRTLPELAGLLIDADVPVPGLTQIVMSLGQGLASFWWVGVMLTGLVFATIPIIRLMSVRLGVSIQVPRPRLMRRLAVARFSMQMSELLRSGITMVDALRILAPTTACAPLRTALTSACDDLQAGIAVDEVFAADRWFDAEYRQLISVGEASGELPELLDRLGQRYERSAQRSIERLASVLEPATILVLASGVGVVVMAAVLPLLRMQEIV
ncbi:MAG: type II secretion system F family protein [Planctomycetota bacterium]